MGCLRSSSRKQYYASFPNYYGKIIKNNYLKETTKREVGIRNNESNKSLILSSGFSSKPSKKHALQVF